MVGLIEAKLAELGVRLPKPTVPRGNYVPYVIIGKLVVISGQVPVVDGKIVITGKVGEEVSIEQGQQAARLCMINVLAHVREACGGDLDKVHRVVRLGGFVASPPSFTQHASVMNGASDLVVAVFGQAGRHARTTTGVASLPGNAAIGVDGMFEIDGRRRLILRGSHTGELLDFGSVDL